MGGLALGEIGSVSIEMKKDSLELKAPASIVNDIHKEGRVRCA